MTVTITLTIAGADTGPFLLYSDADGYTSAFESGITKAALEAGYTSVLVPDYTTVIRVMSAGTCTNYIDIPITTTTTTTTISPELLCLPIYNCGDTLIYRYDVSTNTSTLLPVPGVDFSADCAHTSNKLWTYDSTNLYEWDIVVSPWSAVTSRTIPWPVGFVPSAGLSAISDTILIAVNENSSPFEVVEIDISGVTPIITNKFTLPINRQVSGDFYLTTTGKFIVTTEDRSSTFVCFISQYDYATGTLEIDVDITATTDSPWAIFESLGNIYVGDGYGRVFEVDKNYPYGLTYIQTLAACDFSGASQIPSCLTEQLLTTTTTTSPP